MAAGIFSHEYQGGSHVELLTASGSDPLSRWRLQGTVRREFHNQLKGYVVALIGSSATTRLQIPNSDKKTLGLVQPHLLLQLLAPHEPRVLIELSLLDGSGCRRRIHVSSSQRELSVTPQCGKLPLHFLPAAQWALLCIDMASLMRGLFTGQEFQSLERISIGGSCCVRKVFTMKNMPSSATDLPSACQPPPSAPSFLYTLLNYTIASGARERGDAHDSEVDRKQEQVTHVAFGQKIPVPSHINKYTHLPASRGKDMLSDEEPDEEQEDITGTRNASKKQEIATHVAFGQRIPVPPHIAVKHHIQPMTSGRDDGEAHKKDNAPSPPTLNPHPPPSSRSVKYINRRKDNKTRPTSTEDSPQQAAPESSQLSHDEELAITALKGSGVYSYRSPPHSASRHHQPVLDHVQESSTADSSPVRGARPEDDFLSPDPNIQLHQLDYDWRRYKDSEDEVEEGREEIDELVDKGLQLSLKTRLAHGMISAPDRERKLELGASGTLGSTGDGELSAQLRAAIENHLHESLDLSEMGGPLSPMSTSHLAEKSENGEEELELVYDPELNCFYDPTNGKYYELK